MALLIVEDNAIQRQFLTDLYTQNFAEYAPISGVPDGEAAIASVNKTLPALIVMDIQMPGKNGIQTAREIWATHPSARILFWSQFKDEIYLRELGRIVPSETVYGYLLKTAGEEQLLSAARAVLIDEQCWIDREVRGVTSRAFSPSTGLTDTEYEALLDISLGLTDNTIARRRFLSRRGVQNRLSALYTKMGVDQDADEVLSGTSGGQVFNPRNRAVLVALLRGLLNTAEMTREAELSTSGWQPIAEIPKEKIMIDLEIRPYFDADTRRKYVADSPIDFEEWLKFSHDIDSELIRGVVIERTPETYLHESTFG